MTTARRSIAALAALAALALAGCTTDASPEPTPTPTGGPSPTQSVTATATPSPTGTPVASAPPTGPERPTAETISCDAMLDAAVDADLRAQGYAPYPKEFTQFNFPYAGAAIECPWGVPEDNHPSAYYAWAEFGPGDRETFLELTRQNDYYEVPNERGVWVVWGQEPAPDSGILVTDEWVALADSAERIDDIVWTR